MSHNRSLPHSCYCSIQSEKKEQLKKKFTTIKGLVKATSIIMKQKKDETHVPFSFEDLFALLEEKVVEMDLDLSTL